MNPYRWQYLCEQVQSHGSPDAGEEAVAEGESLSEDDRAALWLYAWARRQVDRQEHLRSIRPGLFRAAR